MKIMKAIEGYIIDCRTRNLSKKTISWYEQKLKFLARWLDEEEDVQQLDRITITQLRTFVLDLQMAQIGRTTINKDEDVEQVSPMTVRGYVQVIKGFFKSLSENRWYNEKKNQRGERESWYEPPLGKSVRACGNALNP